MTEVELAEWEKRILQARQAYYDPERTVLMDDSEYDALEDRLREVYPNHLLLRKVGAAPRKNRADLEHRMYSLEKAKGAGELKKWMDRYPGETMICSFKMDGCALDLFYERLEGGEDYQLTMATTRGDGEVGEDVSAQILNGQVEGIPHFVPAERDHWKVDVERGFHVYGECIIKQSTLRMLNMRQRMRREDEFSNARNLANGTVSMDDVGEIQNRKLCFFAYNTSLEPMDLGEKFSLLKNLGFQVVEWGFSHEQEGMLKEFQDLVDNRSELNYDIDGMVVALDSQQRQAELGYTSHHPRWAVAVKFPDETAVVEISEMEWTVSKYGCITPQALYDPVQLGGAELERVTLHNAQQVVDNNLMPGAKIKICRSGGVIPYLVEVMSTPPGETTMGVIPKECPTCHGEVGWESVEIKCTNAVCSGQIAQSLEHFLTMIEYKGIGEKICEALVEAGLVERWADVWNITSDEWMTTLGWSPDHTEEVMDGLDAIKIDVPFEKLLQALQVPRLGRSIAKKIAQRYPGPGAVLSDINAENWFLGLGPNTGPVIYKALRLRIVQTWPELKRVGFTIKPPVQVSEDAFTICITGTLSKGRKEYEGGIEAAGHIYQSSLSSSTDVLICGSNVGSGKIAKAKKFNTVIHDEDWLVRLLE